MISEELPQSLGNAFVIRHRSRIVRRFLAPRQETGKNDSTGGSEAAGSWLHRQNEFDTIRAFDQGTKRMYR